MNIRNLLLACGALRLFLAFGGGQHYFPDEVRYDWAMQMLRDGPSVIAAHPGHPGFYLILFPIVAVHSAIAQVLGRSPEALNWIPAGANALVSVSVVALVFGIALAITKQRTTALLAAVLAAGSAPLLYFCRHLVPYDAALALGLLTIFAPLTFRRQWLAAMVAGFSAGMSISVYNGGALFALAGICLAAWYFRRSIINIVILCLAAGVPALFLLTIVPRSYWAALRAFSSLTVTQGWFSEGPLLPWAYLWSADHFLLLVIVFGVFASFRTVAAPYAWAAVALYAAMSMASAGLQSWVVYGRTARMLVPLCCIAAATGWSRIIGTFPRWEIASHRALVSVVLIHACVSFAPIVSQRFPNEVVRELSRTLSFSTISTVGSCSQSQSLLPQHGLLLLNPAFLWPVECYNPPPNGRIIYETRHPLQYLPYLFEGYSPEQRSLLERADISTRLLQR